MIAVDWKQALEQRGILQAATAAGWGGYTLNGTPGWVYPLFRADGSEWQNVSRWKALDSNHQPKYMWLYPEPDMTKPEGCDWYWLPGAAGVVKTTHTLHLVCGEPDALTFWEAGIRGVTSFFGEGSIPKNFIPALTKLGVTKVVYWMDNDEPGWTAAQDVYDALDGSGIVFEGKIFHPDYKDPNEFWVHCGFDEPAFRAAFETALPQPFFEMAPSGGSGHNSSTDPINPRVLEALKSVYTSRKHRQRGEWITCSCPNPAHTDKRPSFGYNTVSGNGNCFACGGMNVKTQCEYLGIDVSGLGGYYERPASPNGHNRENGHPTQSPPNAPAPAAAIQIVSSDAVAADYLRDLRSMSVGKTPIFLNPITTLHEFGGMCQILEGGELWLVVGLSGSGKTQFLDSLIKEPLRQQGYHLLSAGGEWLPSKQMGRYVQRYGGSSRNRQKLYKLWKMEQAAGIANGVGVRLGVDELAKDEHLIKQMGMWAGKEYFLTGSQWTIVQLADAAYTWVMEHRGIPVAAFVLDYFQLYGYNADERALPPMKQLQYLKNKLQPDEQTGFPGLVTVVASQVTKEAARLVRTQKEKLDSSHAQMIREDPAMLVTTLTADGNKGNVYTNKNSEGRQGKEAQRDLKIDPMHLRWLDELYAGKEPTL